MKQTAVITLGATILNVELPAAESEALPGVPWGAVWGFPTPAYWVYQVLAKRMTSSTNHHRLGTTLQEEVAACLLGGHGLPASVGLAAFAALKNAGLLVGSPGEPVLLEALSQPLAVQGRSVRYRFARQKAKYLGQALERISRERPPQSSGKVLRNWLVELPGIGPKTASWIARNWLNADDVAILDIHVLRAGHLAGFFDPALTVERHYLQLEEQFLRFSHAIGVRPSDLDAVIWYEMANSQKTVRSLLGGTMNVPRRKRALPAANLSAN